MKISRTQLKEIIKEILFETSTTGGVGGYSTPFAFGNRGKDIATKSLPGYKLADSIDEKKAAGEEKFKKSDATVATKKIDAAGRTKNSQEKEFYSRVKARINKELGIKDPNK